MRICVILKSMAEQSNLPETIAKELTKGTPVEEIKQQLRQQGWSDADILKALDDLMAEDSDELRISPLMAVVGSIIFFVAVVGIVYGVTSYLNSDRFVNSVQIQDAPLVLDDRDAIEVSTEEASILPEDENRYAPFREEFISTDSASVNVGQDYRQLGIEFADKLGTCTPYTMYYTNTIDTQTYSKKVLGMEKNKCNYIETIPNNSQIACSFSSEQQIQLAEYILEHLDEAEKMGVGTFTMSASSDSEATESANPWEVVLNDPETCTISAYEQ